MTQAGRVSGSIERVRLALVEHGIPNAQIRQFDHSTATAAEAAAAIGTVEERIVKSLVFMAGNAPVMVLASGPNRVDTRKVSQLVGQNITRANADQVRLHTGYSIGGVPPVGHASTIQTLVDRDLLQHDEVWAAAGTPNSVFPIDPRALVRITGGRVEDVAQAL